MTKKMKNPASLIQLDDLDEVTFSKTLPFLLLWPTLPYNYIK